MTHHVPMAHMVCAANAVERMADALNQACAGRRALVVCDRRTRGIAGDAAAETLCRAGWTVETIVLKDPPGGSPVCDDLTFDCLRSSAPEADAYVAAGSGVVNDLVKWLAHERTAPYAALATAASMNGYSSANVAPTVRGVKRLVRAAAPCGVFAVPDTLANAPARMTTAGFGDVGAKPMSTADWLMNHHLLGEHYCPVCADLVADIEPLYLERPEAIAACEPVAIRALFDALVFSGVAMTMMGTSAPASGGEHLFSHTLDMMSAVDGIPHDLHGRQVGLGTIVSAALYERLFAHDVPRTVPMPKHIDREFWGPLADAIADEYAAKQASLARLAARMADRGTWDAMRHAVAPRLKPAREIARSLERAGAARMLEDIGCTRNRARAALLHMHEIRARCTVVDAAWLAGIMPGATDDILSCVCTSL